jgi:hypothetical protein
MFIFLSACSYTCKFVCKGDWIYNVYTSNVATKWEAKSFWLKDETEQLSLLYNAVTVPNKAANKSRVTRPKYWDERAESFLGKWL